MAELLIKKNNYKITKKVTSVGMFYNALLAFVKVFFGIVGKSPALVADGIHSLSDLVCDLMVIFASKYANEPADSSHPYGHKKIETFATLILSIILIIVALGIFSQALFHLLLGSSKIPDYFIIFIALFSIVINEYMFRYTLTASKKINSNLLKANAWHHRSDSWSSAVVVVGLLGSFMGFPVMDTLAALVVCFVILKMSITWLIQSFGELIDASADDDDVAEIKNILGKTEGLISFHELRTRKMAGYIYLDVHIMVDKNLSLSEGHFIGEVAEAEVRKKIKNLKDFTMHIDDSSHSHNDNVKNILILPNRNKLNRIVKNSLKNYDLERCFTRLDVYYKECSVNLELVFIKSNIEQISIENIEKIKELIKLEDDSIQNIKFLFELL